MDPLSFTASLATVSGVTIMTSKLVFTLCERVKSAPEDIRDLLEQLQTFQELLDELKTQLHDSRDCTATQSKLQQIWGQSVAHMQRDVTSLYTKLSKLEQLINKKSLGSRVLLSARQMLSEKNVAEYQRKIESHCGVLTCIKATVCDQKLSRLSQQTVQLGDDNNAGFQTISSQIAQASDHLEGQARVGFSNVSSDLKSAKLASDEIHRDLQSRMDDHAERDDLIRQTVDEVRGDQVKTIEMTELGFQAVQSALVTAVSSNREGHESTHALLRQQETFMQRLGNHLAFGNSRNCVRSSRTRSDTWGPTTTSTTFYWETRYHSLPIGKLRISMNQTRCCGRSEETTSHESNKSNMEVTFVPPKWLTWIAVDYKMNFGYDLVGDWWHWGASLRPLTVNQNPVVINALDNRDLGAIHKLFRAGLIHPTDYVLRRGEDLMPWYQYRITERYLADSHDIASLLVYMAENGLPGQDVVLQYFAYCLHLKSSPTFVEDILKRYIWIYLRHGGNLFTKSLDSITRNLLLLRFYSGTAGLISESLFQSSEPWTVDELSSFGICFLGAVGQVDSKFRTRLKNCLGSYRSPLPAAETTFADNIYESTFGIASMLGRFRRLHWYDAKTLLCALCRTGTPSMLRPFIDIGIDLNNDGYRNMLGHAAAAGNLDVVYMLIQKGANGSLALYQLTWEERSLSRETFKHLLELLVEKSRPTCLQKSMCDALSSVIQSSRALSSHPEAPAILIRRKVFVDELMGGSCEGGEVCDYMCLAIRQGLGSLVKLLLQTGAYTNTMSTCLMLSIERGTASCTETLIQHGADVDFLDGSGKSALQLARSNVNAPHPRIFQEIKEHYFTLRCRVTAKQDEETLRVVERALQLKAQSTTISKEQESKRGSEVESYGHRDRTMSGFQSMFKKALRFLSTYYTPPLHERRVEPHYRGIVDFWSLSFYEALLIRVFYLLSYVLLLAIGILAVIRGDKRVPMPSRSVLSALALLLLAYIWVSSPQTMFSPKPDNGQLFIKQDS